MKRQTERMLKEEEFKDIFIKNLNEIQKLSTKQVLNNISKHNIGYVRNGFNLFKYYRKCYRDYYLAYKIAYNSIGYNGKICDVGGFLGVFSATMSDIGYQVSMIEAMKYYSLENGFGDIYRYIREKNVNIIDADIFDKNFKFNMNKKEEFDIIYSIAIIEHYPYSLKNFFNNLKKLKKCRNKAKGGGYIYVSTPNIAYIVKRINFLKGCTPLVRIRNIWDSEIPFTGHCHEMTMCELEEISKLAHLKIKASYYTNNVRLPLLYSLINKFVPNTRECISILLY